MTNLADRLKWRFVMEQTSRPIPVPPAPSRRSIARFLQAEDQVLRVLDRVCSVSHQATVVTALQPMYSAMAEDLVAHRVACDIPDDRRPEDRIGLFVYSMRQHLDSVSPYEAFAWWFVFVFTQAAGSWGTVDGMDYFHQWLDDVGLGVLEDAVSVETYHWTAGHVKACLDELEYAIRYRRAMMEILRRDRDDDDVV